MKKLFRSPYAPLTIVVGFNFFTLFVFYTAPFRWATDNLDFFLFFAFACQAMVIIGYMAGFRKSLRRNFAGHVFQTFSRNKLNFVFIFYSITFLIKYAYFLKARLLDIRGMVNRLLIGIGNPQLGYALSLTDAKPYINWTTYFLISIIDQVFFIIGFLKWSEMSRAKKVLFASFLCIDLFYWMGRGTNFGVISMVTTLAFSSIYKLKSMKLKFWQAFRFYFSLVLLLIISLFVFSHNMNGRAGNKKLDSQVFNLGLSKVDENASFYKIIPGELQQSYLYVVSYLAQGYYHCSLAFDLPYKPTFLLGNNPAIIELAKVFNFDIWKDTYMYRLRSKGVDPKIRWHSAYLWYACDVSFFGVPFLLGFIGYLFGFSWGISSMKNDFLSKIIFVITGNMLLYLFANNSYLSSVFYSLLFILPIWYFTRVKNIRLVN